MLVWVGLLGGQPEDAQCEKDKRNAGSQHLRAAGELGVSDEGDHHQPADQRDKPSMSLNNPSETAPRGGAKGTEIDEEAAGSSETTAMAPPVSEQ